MLFLNWLALLQFKVVYEKMSKSKYNGISPDDMVKEYGADVTRLGVLFMVRAHTGCISTDSFAYFLNCN